MIQTKNIRKAYGRKVVVDNISLDLPKGKVISMIGPNGAGKSTLLGMISRTLKSDGGDVLIDGLHLNAWASDDLAKHMAVMKQSEHISVRITVYDLVCFGRFPYSKGRLSDQDKTVIENAIDYMDLHDLRDRYIDELSGGQRQRAYIASIYAQDTDYILLDEPLNNLDIKYASSMLKLLRRLADDQGKTIIIVIHDINFASAYSDHIVLIKDGVVAMSGSVDEVMQPQVLEDIYGMPFEVVNVNGKKVCAYY